MALEIDIISNTRAAQADVKNLSKSLDGVADSLDELASDAQKGGTKTEKALDGIGDAGKQAGKDVETAGDKMERTFAEMVQDAKKADKAVSDIGDSGSANLGKVTEGAQELKQEIGSNLGEAVSSFRGDLTDLSQVGQDTLGGLAATLASAGPAGIVGALALAAGAVGWGAITQNLADQQEQADKLRDRLSSAYREAAEAGRDYLDVSQMIAEANDLMYNPDRADEYLKLQEDARTLHLDINTIIKANAGDLTAQSVVQGEINSYLSTQDAHAKNVYGTMEHLTEEASNLKDRWQGISDATNEQAINAARSREVTSEMLLDAADKAGKFTEEIDEAGNRLVALPDGTEFVIDVNSGQAHTDLDKFKGDADDVLDELNGKIVRPTVKLRLDTSDYDNWTPKQKKASVIVSGQAGSRNWE